MHCRGFYRHSAIQLEGLSHQGVMLKYMQTLFANVCIQVSLARLGAGFGSALADIFQTESLRILAERISQWEIDTRH
jgi:hypothetical protein